ncbi:MAG: hypothetical protein KKB50_21985 [Planctomycetes bacterium]|nr:hypothetical protein [Planctomycetota bacterium]
MPLSLSKSTACSASRALRVFLARLARCVVLLACWSAFGQAPGTVFAGADQGTPSRSHYFDWINSQYEGTTEAHTLTNLDFFKWLHDEYGLMLDVYSLDVGNIDDGPYTAGVGRLIPYHYGTMESEEFKAQFPRGFAPLVEKAASFGCRLGIWLGPDGFGDTPEEERQRTELLTAFCRDYNFALLKLDGVAGKLRPEKQDALANALRTCRSYCPDLIVLNERIELGKAEPYATTALWEGAETYIDVFMSNTGTAIHHRAGALAREVTPGLTRLLEDHGVCFSSCLDYWEDELVLQAFNRALVVSPQIYGNPWFLRDDEFPKLARLFNLARRYRDVLPSAIALPETQYGPYALARGDQQVRLITLRNLTWEPVTYAVQLDDSIGLVGGNSIELWRLHPSERILGRFSRGTAVEVEVLPFRTCLLLASSTAVDEVGVEGCDYEIVRDVPDKPVIVKLLGMPGTEAAVRLASGNRSFKRAALDGVQNDALTEGRETKIAFGGTRLGKPWHRKIGALEPCPVPEDAEALYEATCFAADSNALEVRCIDRSGPSSIPQVQAARAAFFAQKMFVNRGIWDRNLFDGDLNTHFVARLENRVLRVNFGEPLSMDRIVIRIRDREEPDLNPALHRFAEDAVAEVSVDLRTWTVLKPSWAGKGTIAVIDVPSEQPVQYFRIAGPPRRIAEIEAYYGGRALDRSSWRASNLFDSYTKKKATAAWTLSCRLDEIPKNATLAVAINGRHGDEGAYAAIRVDGKLIGAPDRAVSYPSNTWEYYNVKEDGDYTYYFPLSDALAGRAIEVVVLIIKGGENVKPEAWLTAYPIPFESRELVLYDTP